MIKIRTTSIFMVFLVAVTGLVMTVAPAAAVEAEDLAKKLANPVTALISVPIQANYDQDIGPDDDGSVWRINIQPVVRISLNDNRNLISRTILPVIDLADVNASFSSPNQTCS